MQSVPGSRFTWLKHNHLSIGLFGLYLFALSGVVFKAGVYIGLVLMSIGFVFSDRRSWPRVASQPVLALSLITSAYIVLRLLATLTAYSPQHWPRIVSETWDLLATGGLFACLVAWWIAGDSRRLSRVLLLALLGLLIAVVLGTIWPSLAHSLATSHRHLFGMGNGVGLYAVTAITGLLTVAPAVLWNHPRWQTPARRILATVLVCLAVTMLAAVMLLSQTRAVWLATLLVVPVVLIVLSRHTGGESAYVSGSIHAITRLCVVALLVIVFAFGYELVMGRMAQEMPSLQKILSLDFSALPDSSVSYRVWLWDDALRRIGERPLFGWGSGSAGIMIEGAALPGGYSHYHNLYLQLATELGLVGLALFLLWFALAVRSARQAYRARSIGIEMYLLTVAMVALYLIVVMFQIRHDDERGVYYVALLGAMALAHGFGSVKTP